MSSRITAMIDRPACGPPPIDHQVGPPPLSSQPCVTSSSLAPHRWSTEKEPEPRNLARPNKTASAERTSESLPAFLRSLAVSAVASIGSRAIVSDPVLSTGHHSSDGNDGHSNLHRPSLRCTTSPKLPAHRSRLPGRSCRFARMPPAIAPCDSDHPPDTATGSARVPNRRPSGWMNDDGKALAKRWPRAGISTDCDFPANGVVSTLKRMHRVGWQREP